MNSDIFSVSKAKLEYVVNAPQKPMATKRRQRGSVRTRSVVRTIKKPMRKLPVRLMNTVASGNVAVTYLTVQLLIRKRLTAPSIPPIATQAISLITAPSYLQAHRRHASLRHNKQRHGSELRQHRERNQRRDRNIVESTEQSAPQKPSHSVPRVEEAIGGASPIRGYHSGYCGTHHRLLRPHADAPHRHPEQSTREAS